MSTLIPKRSQILSDAFTEALANMDPADADTLKLIQEMFNNQIAFSSAIFSLQRHAFLDGQKIRALEKMMETNQ